MHAYECPVRTNDEAVCLCRDCDGCGAPYPEAHLHHWPSALLCSDCHADAEAEDACTGRAATCPNHYTGGDYCCAVSEARATL